VSGRSPVVSPLIWVITVVGAAFVGWIAGKYWEKI
jgi:hypothetical protein